MPVLQNKDTADANGDVFFYLGDRLLIPMACRHDPGWMMCKGQQLLDHDSVYTKYIVEVDSTFGGCPTGGARCTKYAACNPTDMSGSIFKCYPHTADVGYADVKQRYAARRPTHRSTLFDVWKVRSGASGASLRVRELPPPDFGFLACSNV